MGILPGSDPELAKEHVLLTASYDYRPGRERGDDDLRPGENELSGAVALLEVARALAAGRAFPRASIVFLFTTGAEMGRFGLIHYAENPTVPLADTVACLAVKRIGHGPPSWAALARRRASWTNLPKAFNDNGLPVVSEPRKVPNLYQRMDGFQFARRGVVATTLASSDPTGKDGARGHAIDYEHFAACTEVLRRGTLLIADGTHHARLGPPRRAAVRLTTRGAAALRTPAPIVRHESCQPPVSFSTSNTRRFQPAFSSSRARCSSGLSPLRAAFS